MTDLVYDGTKRVIKSNKGKGKGKYYVLELKNGKFKRNYNLDPKLITKYTKVPVTGFILVSEGEL
jgi:outer membrane protein assembly factor BamB